MKIHIKFSYLLTTVCLILLTGCTTLQDYVAEVMSKEREELVVYQRDYIYDDSQSDLELPPDLISPTSLNSVTVPELVNERGMELFTVDTELNDIKLVRSGRDSFLSLKNIDKEKLWLKIESFCTAYCWEIYPSPC